MMEDIDTGNNHFLKPDENKNPLNLFQNGKYKIKNEKGLDIIVPSTPPLV